MTASNAATRAELELLEQGSIVVEDETLAFELLTRARQYRVTGRVEPIGARFRVTIHARPERPVLELDVPAARAAVERILGPHPVAEVTP